MEVMQRSNSRTRHSHGSTLVFDNNDGHKAILLGNKQRTRYDFFGSTDNGTDTLICNRCDNEATTTATWWDHPNGRETVNSEFCILYLCAFHTAAHLLEVTGPPF